MSTTRKLRLGPLAAPDQSGSDARFDGHLRQCAGSVNEVSQEMT
ncbi:hypothetical protein [Pollutimonas subterranea]